jgi:hypothetical protein
MTVTGRFFATAGGAIAAAFGAALCCAGPTVAAAMGISAAGLSNLLPFRPLMVVAAVGALYYGFHLLDREEKACDLERPCADPEVRRRMRWALWVATALVMLFGLSPIWVRWAF